MPKKKPSDQIIAQQQARAFDRMRNANQPLRIETLVLDKGGTATNVRPGLKQAVRTIDAIKPTRRRV
jgi:hypothetical protein